MSGRTWQVIKKVSTEGEIAEPAFPVGSRVCIELGDKIPPGWEEAGTLRQSAALSIVSLLDAGLSVRAANALAGAGIFDISETDALSDKDLLDIKNLGVKSALEIRTCRLRALRADEADD